MTWWDDANQLAEQVSRDDDSTALRKLTELVHPYVLRVRAKYGFSQVSVKQVCQAIATDAVCDALVQSRKRGMPFMECLTNAARDVFRTELRLLRSRLSDELALALAAAAAAAAAADDVAKPCLNEALSAESEFCQEVLGMWFRGSSVKEIAMSLNRDAGECERERINNIRHIRRFVFDKTVPAGVRTTSKA